MLELGFKSEIFEIWFCKRIFQDLNCLILLILKIVAFVNRMKKSSVAKKILELRLLAIFTTVADSRKIFVCFFVEGNNQNVYCFCPFTVFPKRLRCTACNREGYWRPTRDVEKLFRWYEQFASRNKKKNFCSRKHPTTISEHTNKLRSCWKPKKSSHANLSLNSGTEVWC